MHEPQPTPSLRGKSTHPGLRRGGGLSPVRLERMRAILRREVDGGRVPGLVTLVSRRGETHVEAMGTLAFDAAAPMRRDTLFRLASMTKPITAVAAMTLVEDCTLRLDDAVDRWLPELADRRVLRRVEGPLDDTVPAKRSITVRDLLTFRSGYGEVAFLAGVTDLTHLPPPSPMQIALATARLPLADWIFGGTADDFMARLGALPLVDQPGERWLYHMSAEILGVLVARASGKSLEQLMRERIFEPLGMKDTSFRVPTEKLDRFPPCYGTDPRTGEVVVHDPASGGRFHPGPAFESGGGGLVSTVDDMHAFGSMLLHGGASPRGDRVLARPTIELMTTDQITNAEKARSPFFPGFWDVYGWGLGLGLVARRAEAGRNAGSFGWDGTFSTFFWIDPKEDLVGIHMEQRPPSSFRMPGGDFWTAVYQAIDD